jgi:catechol 2,3-dioxygenase-like lactoylglutathione lyase family enzyme
VFDHVSLRASDRAATERFYDTVLAPLGVDGRHRSERSTLFGNFELSIAQATEARPVTTGLHLGLRAPSTDAVNGFWELGLASGFRSDGEPGPRPQYGDDYYGAFLLDPDGNSIEAVRHGGLREQGLIDHLWLRTTDLPAARAFSLRTAEHADLTLRADEPGRHFRLRGPRGGSLTFVAAAHDTAGVHLALPAAPAVIDAWHDDMIAAGYRSDGAPGPRQYHPAYYGAFVLDPAGHSFELVDHGGLLGERG